MINNIISSSNPTNAAALSLQAPANNSDVNVQYLVAKALADAFKTNSMAQPSDKQQLLDAIEQAIANAAASSSPNYSSSTQFWKNLAATLPANSPLKDFATAQWHILVDNPQLEKWQAQLSKDQASASGAESEDKKMQEAITDIQDMINYCQDHWYNPGCLVLLISLYPALGAAILVKKAYDAVTLAPAEAKVQSDKAVVANLEQNLLKRSGVVDQQFAQSAGAGLSEGNSENQRLTTMLDQIVGLQKVLIRMDQIQS